MNFGFEDISSMMDDFLIVTWPRHHNLAGDTFKIDIQEDEAGYTIEAELPGVKKEDINVTLNDGKLKLSIKKEEISEDKQKNYIHRERKYAQMARNILLADADNDGIQAKLRDGVLTIIVSKKEKADHAKCISIE